MRRIVLAAVFAVLLAGCANMQWPGWAHLPWDSGEADRPGATTTPLLGTNWVVVELGGAPATGGTMMAFNVSAEGKLSGRAGCNTYFGTVSLKDDRIAVEGIGSTKMACASPLMEQEIKYIDALNAARYYSISEKDGRLRLMNAKHAVLVILRRY